MVVRVAEPGKPAFQLRKGEEGISVFDLQAVKPPLTEAEILDGFRVGNQTIVRSVAEIEQKGLQVVPIPGAEPLPERLRQAHAEIRPSPGMTRGQFKQILKELE
jgi:2-iminoacetate synthase ThiH